jgi:hypothetical protein
MTTDTDKEVLRALTERNKVADYAMQVLGMDEKRAEAFVKVAGNYLRWEGAGLQFKTASGTYVAADDEQSTGFFRREFDYLIPEKKVEGQQAEIPPELIEKAKDGNWTARGRIFNLLFRGKGSEDETKKQLDALLKGKTPKDGGDGERKRDASGKFVIEGREADASNPWSKDGWNLTSQGRVLRNDPARAERLAKSARSFIGATKATA